MTFTDRLKYMLCSVLAMLLLVAMVAGLLLSAAGFNLQARADKNMRHFPRSAYALGPTPPAAGAAPSMSADLLTRPPGREK